MEQQRKSLIVVFYFHQQKNSSDYNYIPNEFKFEAYDQDKCEKYVNYFRKQNEKRLKKEDNHF
jgi:hypothetical protein